MNLTKYLKSLEKLPAGKMEVATFLLGNFIPLISTMGLKFVSLTDTKVEVLIPNKRKVQNHIHQVHAMGTAMAIETASGFVLGMNIDEKKLPLLKSISINYIKRSEGAIRAIANLGREAQDLIHGQEKGEIEIDVRVFDERGQVPVEAKVVWAWIPARR